MNTKIIYLVFELGAGIIHLAFDEITEAEKALKNLEDSTELNCFEILQIPLQETKK